MRKGGGSARPESNQEMLKQHSDKVASLQTDTGCSNHSKNQPGGAGLRCSGSDSYNQYRKRGGYQHNDSEALRQQRSNR
jgi:hypothetical protein